MRPNTEYSTGSPVNTASFDVKTSGAMVFHGPSFSSFVSDFDFSGFGRFYYRYAPS